MSRVAGSAKLLRAMNASATLAHLLQAGKLTRAELRERTGLSKPTSSEMLRLLTDAGLAVVTGRTAGAVGPTAEIYAPNSDAAYAVAISVRDTMGSDRPALATALCDLGGDLRDRAESHVDLTRVGPGEAVAAAVAEACRRAGADPKRVHHIQVGVAGSYDPRTDVLHHVDVPGWARTGILAELRAAIVPLAPATVALENDVKLAAIAERHRGAAVDADSFCLLWLASGVGLATNLGGTLLRGYRGGAGEIGYLPVCAGHPPRWSRGPGDLQDLIGGDAVVALAAECGVTAATPGDAVRAADALDVQRFFDELGERIAFAVATVVAVLEPPLVVLAGEVAQAGGARLRDAVAAASSRVPSTLSGLTESAVQIAVTAVADDPVLLGGLDAGLAAVHESLINSLALPSTE
jgi:predicted NBD/HSP70 family sugar kinase